MAAVGSPDAGVTARAESAAKPSASDDAFRPIARWALVGFYAFAGFAKLNSAFFDTTVSCGNVYFDETARTLGVATPLAVGHGGWASLVPVGTALIELSIPVLLCIRR